MIEFHPDFTLWLPEILVVDDEPGYRRLLAKGLRRWCAGVHMARSGMDAVQVLREAPAVDLVLLDVAMPRMDGTATLAALRKVNPALRVCFLSRDDPWRRREVYQADELLARAEFVFSKTYRLEEIPQRVRQLLEPTGQCEERVVSA